MKKVIFNVAAVIAMSLSVTAHAANNQPDEAHCKKSVQSTLDAMSMVTKLKGEAQKLKDLSEQDIRDIENSKGACAAAQEINKRTMK